MYERVKDSADSMMMAIVFEVGEYTSFTVISCPLIKQTSTPSGSQPLSLRARHLPLPQGTAFKMSAHSRENNIRADACLTPAPKQWKAQSADITDDPPSFPNKGRQRMPLITNDLCSETKEGAE